MKNYTMFFEFFGRKLKMTVSAESKEAAKWIVMNRIKFHEIREQPNNDTNDVFKNIMDIISGKKA